MQNISCRYEDPIIKSIRAMKMLAPYEGLDVYLFYLEGIRNGSVYYEIYNYDGDKIFEAVRPLSRFRKSIRDMILRFPSLIGRLKRSHRLTNYH